MVAWQAQSDLRRGRGFGAQTVLDGAVAPNCDPLRCGWFDCWLMPQGARRDVLVFTALPRTEDVEIAGPVDLHLCLTCDTPDADITFKLID